MAKESSPGIRGMARGLWRLAQPACNTHGFKMVRLPRAYAHFLANWRTFRAKGGTARFDLLAPCLWDGDPSTQTGGGHYFFQDIWALRRIARFKPEQHIDVGSRLDGFVGQVTVICPVMYIDIRPPRFELPDFLFKQGSVLELPFPDASVSSLSCLHTLEHIGLGRYGDPLNPEGFRLGMLELGRVLKPGGQLLISMPVGVEQTWFDSQRITNPLRPLEILSDLTLKEFSAVTDAGVFREGIKPADVVNAKYACGLYVFTRS